MRAAVAILLLAASAGLAQKFEQRGYLETRLLVFPQTAPNDSGQVVADSLFRWEASWKPLAGLRLAAGVDARTDTHHQTARQLRLDWQDRSLKRPALSVRRLSASYYRGGFSLEAGKQLIRWGKADILNPTDRFAPRDYLAVVDSDFLGVTAARLTYETGANTLDLVWAPRFTPSRTPLLNQRWTVLPPAASAVRLEDLGARLPGGGQFGARWNYIGAGYEGSLVFYEGWHHLPLFEGRLRPDAPGGLRVEFQRFYPRLRLYGADAAVPLRWFTVKGEGAYFTSSTPLADEYVQYVAQLERQSGEWSLVGGYAGEWITATRNPTGFAPDRGLTGAFLARANRTLDARRSFAVEGALRRNGKGSWTKAEYSQTFGQHWRLTGGFTWVRGDQADFLGQYRRNSHAFLLMRYSF